ncbi:MAG: hypothetical protein JSW11_06695 [Candidatus Heimdallarchaeota archaeon]|nr:MAG: hypothetical protein JSW11_06695 [Candidatus Heimdallarchaeota archaeon]
MASQYITFIVIFILGLNMVIITNLMFLTLSDQFRENIADVEMTRILDLIQKQIQQSLLLSTDGSQLIEQQLELPAVIGEMSPYSIEIYNSSDNQIILHGFSSNGDVDQIKIFTVAPKYIIETSDSIFESVNTLLALHIEKNGNNIVITIS